MRKIFFGTNNEGKLKEARAILGIAIDGTDLEIEEIQSLDPIKVASFKAKNYFLILRKPVLVDDVSLTFNALGKLPGPYIKDFLEALGHAGLLALLDNKKDRSASAQTTLAFAYGQNKVEFFTGALEGTIADKPRGDNGFGWDPIFIPNGQNKTFAEMSSEEKNQISHRALALQKFKAWLDKTR